MEIWLIVFSPGFEEQGRKFYVEFESIVKLWYHPSLVLPTYQILDMR